MPVKTRTSYKIRPEDYGTSVTEQLVEIAISQRDASERNSSNFRNRLHSLYDIWRGLTTGNYSPTKNNIWIPLIFSTIQVDTARKMGTSFTQWPVLGFDGFGPDDKPIARKTEAMVNAQLIDAQILTKEIITFLGADLYGTAVSQLLWDHRSEVMTRTQVQALPLSQEIVRTRKKERAVTFDGPNYRTVDLLDFYDQPNYGCIQGNQGMPRCGVRYYLDVDDCWFLASEEGGNIFDEREVRRMVREDGVPAQRLDEARQRRFNDQGDRSGQYPSDLSDRPVEIQELWGHIPREFARHFGGSSNVVITVANDKYLLRARANPFDHQLKPFLSYSPTPDPHYFHAPGKAEVAYQLQVAGNRFINQQLDAADLLIHPMFAFNRQMGVNTRNLWAGPGRIFGVDGDPKQAIQPLQMDFRSLGVGTQMTSEMWSFIQMGSGIQEDTIMGGEGPSRETARGYLGRREAASSRLLLESVLYEANYLEPLGNFFQSMDSQFLTLPREVIIVGDAAIEDPDTGQPIEDTRVDIDGSVLNTQYAARATGTTMHLSRETEKANMLTIFQTLAGAGPEVTQTFNMVNFFRQMFRMFGLRNVNELIEKPSSISQTVGQLGGGQAIPEDAGAMMQLVGGGGPSAPGSMQGSL
jgi:hypothetical protein